MMTRLNPFAVFIVSLVLLSCGDVKLPATGQEDEIILFADDSTWTFLERTVRSVFQDTVFTPQPELWFVVRRAPMADFGKYEKHMNRILLAPLDGTGPAAEFMRRSLGPSVQQLVEQGEEFVINKYDPKARGQILMYLTGPDLASLRSSMENEAPELLYYFKRTSLRRELASVQSESGYHKKEIERSLLKRYDWTMTIQHDYLVARDSAEGGFFWVRRATPADMERWIFVAWREVKDPRILTDRYAIALRDSLTRRYMRTIDEEAFVEIAPYYLQIENISFLDRFAYEMRGNWRFSDKTGGGPFVNYTFYDEGTRRVYVLDGSIFAPRVEKKKLILQVDALLHTFRTIHELSDKEKVELGEGRD
ncbi:MAG: DUF4837 family protein [Ignavibacteriales bacterium]|nr:DUF4837 family protein [Ignavibacteriales bacterium]